MTAAEIRKLRDRFIGYADRGISEDNLEAFFLAEIAAQLAEMNGQYSGTDPASVQNAKLVAQNGKLIAAGNLLVAAIDRGTAISTDLDTAIKAWREVVK